MMSEETVRTGSMHLNKACRMASAFGIELVLS